MGSGPDQHQHSLKQTSDAHQLKLLAEDLQCRRSGSNQDAIEIARLDEVWKNIEASGDSLRNCKCNGTDSIKQGNLWERPPFDMTNPLKQRDQSKELHPGDYELCDRAN